MHRDAAGSIESPRSWHAAFLTLAILSVSFGSPLLAVVGLRDMQAAMHTDRSVLSLASALVWIGNGVGGIPMGWLADRIGIRKTVAIGHADDGRGPGAVQPRHGLGAVCRARAADRLPGQRRHLCAADGLCQPLVRPPPRHRARADFLRTVHRRHDLAVAAGGRDEAVRLAAGHAGLWRRRAGDPAAADAAAAAARTAGCRSWPGRPAARRPGAGPASERRDGADLRRQLLLLRADGAFRPPTWSRSAAMSASPPATARRCCR